MPTLIGAPEEIPPPPPLDRKETVNVPGYEILGELGRGGMGVVYKARQISLNRTVALKMILSAAHAGSNDLTRFRREAEVIGKLQHPNIVQIIDVGESEGKPYFSLEFIDGGSLADQLDGTPWRLRQAAQMISKLSEAAFFAHERGIVHRDLKPANILLAADGTPKITDFGLAKQINESTGPTQSGSILGTPSYMAPEQAEGKAREVGPAADIYALGTILYELLTGRPPFRAETPLDTLLQVAHLDPVPPRRLQPKISRDLETIILMCLQKEPDKRYRTAHDLAVDLNRFLTGDPILARPVGPLGRGLKWLRRQPSVAVVGGLAVLLTVGAFLALLSDRPMEALTALVVPVTVVGSGGMLWQWRRAQVQMRSAHDQKQQADAARKEAEEQRQQAEAARKDAEEQAQRAAKALATAQANLYFLQISLTERELAAANLPRAEAYLDDCPTDARSWEWHYLRRMCHSEVASFDGTDRPLLTVAYSTDGAYLAAGGWDQIVRVWVEDTGEPFLELRGHTAQVTGIAFSPDRRRLATSSGDQTVAIWDARVGQQLRLLKGHAWSVFGLAFSPDGHVLASAGGDQLVRLWSPTTGQELGVLRGHGREVTCVAFSPDGQRIASGGNDQVAKVWDATTRQELLTLIGHSGPILSIAFSPEGRWLATAGDDRTVRIWDSVSGREMNNCRGHVGPVWGVAFAPKGDQLASVGADRIVRIWDMTTGQEVASLRGHTGVVTSVAFRPDGQRLATGSEDMTVKVWEATRDPEGRVLRGHTNEVLVAAFSHDSRRLISGSGRLLGNGTGETKLWDVFSGREFATLQAEGLGYRGAAFNGDGRAFATGSDDGAVTIWNAMTTKSLAVLRNHSRAVTVLSYSPDRRLLASAGEEGDIKVISATNGKEISTIRPGLGSIVALAFSPDSRRLAVAFRDKLHGRSEVRIWAPEIARELLALGEHSTALNALIYTRDGRSLVLADRAGNIVFLSAETGETQGTLTGHGGEVSGLALGPDGQRLASASHDQTVKVWDVTRGQELLTLRGHTAEVLGVAFSPDGQYIASFGADQTIRLWDGTKQAD
jgi:WD40 repeat protein